MATSDVTLVVGVIAAVVGAAGIPFLPLWGALADRYLLKPLVVRSFVVNRLAVYIDEYTRPGHVFYLFAGQPRILFWADAWQPTREAGPLPHLPVACVFTGLGSMVSNIARRQPLQSGE